MTIKAISEKVDRLFRFEIAPIQRVKAFWRFSEMSKRFRSALLAAPMLLVGWLAVLAATTLLTDAAPAHLVLFPTKAFLADLPPQTAIIAASAFTVSLGSEGEGAARSLYQQGAWLVLPAGLPGCAPRSD